MHGDHRNNLFNKKLGRFFEMIIDPLLRYLRQRVSHVFAKHTIIRCFDAENEERFLHLEN